jgi:glycosyltransferase involved in cell wall biosynthesis
VRPKVSVVTTVYNGEPYFDRAVPSILAQNFEDFEFVLVDDGSTDRTAELLRELPARDPRVRVFSPGRLGVANAYNYGVAQARGEYIAHQDFDDRSYPDRLRLQVELLDSQPELGLVGGHFVVVDEKTGERYARMPPTEHGAILSAMARYIPIAHSTATYRRRAWSEAGGYPVVNNLIDLRFYLRVGKLGWRFGGVPQLIGEHFVHESSFFHRTLKYADRQRDLARVQAQAIRELGLPSWMYLFALGRHAYAYIPPRWKRIIRRGLVGLREQDV